MASNPAMSPMSKTHVIVGSVLAGLQILNGGAALGDVIGEQAFGIIALITAAFQAGWAFYTSATSIPTASVAAVAQTVTNDTTGEEEQIIVAGPAVATAAGLTGPDLADPVEVRGLAA